MANFDQSELKQFADFHASRTETTTLTRWQQLKLIKLSTVFLLVLGGIAFLLALAAVMAPLIVSMLASIGVNLASVPAVAWLIEGVNNLLAAGGLVGLGLLLFLLARVNLLTNKKLRVDAGCPNCHEHDIIRIQRLRSDRMLSLFVPVRRFACRNCTWEGRRLGRDNAKIPFVNDEHPIVETAEEL